MPNLSERLKKSNEPAPVVKSYRGKTPTAEQQEIITMAQQILAAKQSGCRVLMIEAGAGTGKTTSYQMLYLGFV